MKKIDKVKRGLEACIVNNPDEGTKCRECPYLDPNTYCLNRMKTDALEVIKKLVPDEPSCGPDYCDI